MRCGSNCGALLAHTLRHKLKAHGTRFLFAFCTLAHECLRICRLLREVSCLRRADTATTPRAHIQRYTHSPFALASFTGMYLLESVSAWSQQAQPAAACVRKQTKRMPTSAALGVVISTWLAGAAFGVAGLLRSNGVLLVGYLGFTLLRLGVTTRGPARSVQWVLIAGSTVGAAGLALLPYVLYQLYGKFMYCSAAPASVRTALEEAFGLLLPDHPTQPDRPWCADALTGGVPTLPNMYSFIQETYWGVGPFKYYQFKQIPQFLLAAPVLTVAVSAVYLIMVEGGGRPTALLVSMLKGLFVRTTSENADPPTERDGGGSVTGSTAAKGRQETDTILAALDKGYTHSPSASSGDTLPPLPPLNLRQVTAGSVSGFVSPKVNSASHTDTTGGADHRVAEARAGVVDVSISCGDLLSHRGLPPAAPILEPGVLPYALHLGVMAGVALVIMHIQVAARFLASSSPLVYWYMAHVWLAQSQPQGVKGEVDARPRGVLCCSPAWRVVFWLCLYTVLGPLLFGNFYNWT
jgi:hypothetical protein